MDRHNNRISLLLEIRTFIEDSAAKVFRDSRKPVLGVVEFLEEFVMLRRTRSHGELHCPDILKLRRALGAFPVIIHHTPLVEAVHTQKNALREAKSHWCTHGISSPGMWSLGF